ncbi:MAG TPA: VWA domain-containing protein [Candidatus Sulfotelmatobacter sp.]|nr:VWA domain-containing protein [Candidatus Sulfotelmatobacter sp.]
MTFATGVSAGTAHDSPPVAYRTGTSEVRVTFFATGQNNRPLANVTVNDFAVVDSETVIRDFRSLNRSNETSLDIVLLLDCSGSVAPVFRKAVQDVLRLASPPSPQTLGTISVVTFSGLKPTLLCADECGSSAAAKLISVTASGPTPLFDTLTFTAKFLSRRYMPGVRQVVIVFSDGVDTISGASPKEALEAVASMGAILYAVDSQSEASPSNKSPWLHKMAEATGGRTFSLQDDTHNILEAVLADLRASYVVTYALPSHAAGFHSLRILPKHDLNLQFHCRRGYFYEEGQ